MPKAQPKLENLILHLILPALVGIKLICTFKVEKILKGSLHANPSPSPSVKIQIMGGRVCLRCEGKTLLGVVNKVFVTPAIFQVKKI